MELNWPIVLWASGVIFLAGGAWFELRRLRIDFTAHMKAEAPLLAEVPKLGVRVDRCEEDIKEMRPLVLGQGGTMP